MHAAAIARLDAWRIRPTKDEAGHVPEMRAMCCAVQVRVATHATREDMAIVQLARKHGISPVMIDHGKVRLAEHPAKTFGRSRHSYAA